MIGVPGAKRVNVEPLFEKSATSSTSLSGCDTVAPTLITLDRHAGELIATR